MILVDQQKSAATHFSAAGIRTGDKGTIMGYIGVTQSGFDVTLHHCSMEGVVAHPQGERGEEPLIIDELFEVDYYRLFGLFPGNGSASSEFFSALNDGGGKGMLWFEASFKAESPTRMSIFNATKLTLVTLTVSEAGKIGRVLEWGGGCNKVAQMLDYQCALHMIGERGVEVAPPSKLTDQPTASATEPAHEEELLCV